jgi:hypothetical protein
MSEPKPSFKTRVIKEIKEVAVLFIYLLVFFCAFTTYRLLVLSEYRIGYAGYVYAVVEALILSKVIIIGRLLKIGHRFKNHPLIVPTLWKTATFSLFIIAFAILEHLCDGFLHHESLAQIRERVMSIGVPEMLARALMICTALFPLFAIEEIGGVVGEGKIQEWMFRRKPTESVVEHSTT